MQIEGSHGGLGSRAVSSWEDLMLGHDGKPREAREEAGSVVLVRENEVWGSTLVLPSQIFTSVLVGGENPILHQRNRGSESPWTWPKMTQVVRGR